MDIESLLSELDDNIKPIQNPNERIRDDELTNIIQLSLPKIKVLGVGGAGNNFITALYEYSKTWRTVETIAINTDAGQLSVSKAHRRVLIGKETTKGHGAGNDPSIGRRAFEESRENIQKLIGDSDLLILCAGLGGGTGSGVTPGIVELTKEMNLLTISFVTIPFKCEGKVRIKNALDALAMIIRDSTVTIVVPNERLIKLAPRRTIQSAFDLANNLLIQLVRSLADLIEKPGLINVDFADVRKILSYKGLALPGIAEANSNDEKRALTVAEKILNNPLLEVNPAFGKGALIEIVAGEDLLLSEAYDIVNRFTTVMGEDKEIIFGLRIDPAFDSKIRVSSLITGIEVLDEKNYDLFRFPDGSIVNESIFEEITDIPLLK